MPVLRAADLDGGGEYPTRWAALQVNLGRIVRGRPMTTNTAVQPAIDPNGDPKEPRYAVWPVLGTLILNTGDIPVAKHYDGAEPWELSFLGLSGDEPEKRRTEKGNPFLTEDQTREWCVRCDQYEHMRCRGPVKYLRDSTGQPTKISLREFWKIYEIDDGKRFDVRDLIDQDLEDGAQGLSNDPQLSLGVDWNFVEIEKLANGRQGHRFQGLRMTSYLRMTAVAAYDLDEGLHRVHPNVPASAVADFWKSYEVHRHLCQFVKLLVQNVGGPIAPELRRQDQLLYRFGDESAEYGDPGDAFLCAQIQISNYARELAEEGQIELCPDPVQDRSGGANVTPPGQCLSTKAEIDQLLYEKRILNIDEWSRKTKKLDQKGKGVDRSTIYRLCEGKRITRKKAALLAASVDLNIVPESWISGPNHSGARHRKKLQKVAKH